jgi:uncharacterized FlaG/YvyC family protein
MVNVGMNIAGDIRLGVSAVSDRQTFPAEANLLAKPSTVSGLAQKQTSATDDRQEDFVQVSEAVNTVNQMLLVKSTNLIFEFYDKADPPVVKVVDKQNGEIIREIPSKELREIAKALNNIADTMNSNSGLLLDEQL